MIKFDFSINFWHNVNGFHILKCDYLEIHLLLLEVKYIISWRILFYSRSHAEAFVLTVLF